jgi:Tfp pilus assembly protein PilV
MQTATRPKIAVRRRRCAGFSIPEVALAACVMALGIATAITAIQMGFRTLDVARGTTLASQILQSEIERVRMMSWTSIDALPASDAVDLSTMFTSSPALAASYTVTETVTDVIAGEMRQILVSAEWNSYDGRSHQLSMMTYYTKNGLYDYNYTLARP